MIKKIVMEISKSEFENLAENALDIYNDINEDIGSMFNAIAEIEDPGIKINLTECLRNIRDNTKRLYNGYVVYKD